MTPNKALQATASLREAAPERRRYAMRTLLAVILLLTANPVQADPHYIQALHPYYVGMTLEEWGKYLSTFKGEISTNVESAEQGENEPTVYRYLYVIDIQNGRSFELDIHCPGSATIENISGVSAIADKTSTAKVMEVYSDPRIAEPNVEVTKSNSLSWAYLPKLGRQGVWLYSTSPPTDRMGTLRGESSDKSLRSVSHRVSGPSCISEKARRN